MDVSASIVVFISEFSLISMTAAGKIQEAMATDDCQTDAADLQMELIKFIYANLNSFYKTKTSELL